jgi:hypothetical protein
MKKRILLEMYMSVKDGPSQISQIGETLRSSALVLLSEMIQFCRACTLTLKQGPRAASPTASFANARKLAGKRKKSERFFYSK